MSVFIIAEAGVNHNGSIELAKQLIDVASSAGADAVKFQTFKAEKLVTKTLKKLSIKNKIYKMVMTHSLICLKSLSLMWIHTKN